MDYAETIVAVSSASGGTRAIVRLSGPQAHRLNDSVFKPDPDVGWVLNPRGGSAETRGPRTHPTSRPRLQSGRVHIDGGLMVDAKLYLFFAPRSYTGQDMAELHVLASPVLVEALLQRLLATGLRPAGPGEFTARAYLNGKLDLAQAEAVNEVIAGSNRFQLKAAERLLAGRLSESAAAIRSALLECLSLIEAGLDFSGEEIEFISADQAAERLNAVATDLEELLAGSIRYESLLDVPAIGIAGAPNAGKSSLLNKLLGRDRSIVSDQAKTTRDVLSDILTIAPAGSDTVTSNKCQVSSGTSQTSNVPASNLKLHTSNSVQCVLFDCAGLLAHPESLIDRLAQQAATEALRHCRAVLFCVDLAKADWSEDVAVRALVESEKVVFVATKSDLLPAERLDAALESLNAGFGARFLPVSAQANRGLDTLRDRIMTACLSPDTEGGEMIALTTRHKQSVTEALSNVREAARHVGHGDDEVAATLIRAAHEALTTVDQHPLDEQVLDHIFGRFCIGK